MDSPFKKSSISEMCKQISSAPVVFKKVNGDECLAFYNNEDVTQATKLYILFPGSSFPKYIEGNDLFNMKDCILHNVSAFGFFALLAYNSLFLFTKSSGNMTENKKKRNIIFRVCGIGMIVSFLTIIPISIFNWWGGVWLVEAIALAFFGISWLTKANCYSWLFADKK